MEGLPKMGANEFLFRYYSKLTAVVVLRMLRVLKEGKIGDQLCSLAPFILPNCVSPAEQRHIALCCKASNHLHNLSIPRLISTLSLHMISRSSKRKQETSACWGCQGGNPLPPCRSRGGVAVALLSVQQHAQTPARFLCKQNESPTTTRSPSCEFLLLYAWSLLSPWRFQLAEMTYLYFFSRSSLGIQLILSTTLNQKQTLAQGTSIPEDKEGTNTLHQRRKPHGQIFRDSFLQPLLPCEKQGAERGMHPFGNSRGSLWGRSHSTQNRKQASTDEIYNTHPSQMGPRGGHLFLRVIFTAFPRCLLWLAAPASQTAVSTSAGVSVQLCERKGKQEREREEI